jgi:hypothetical protein
MRFAKLLACLAAPVLLLACGGGGDSSDGAPPPAPGPGSQATTYGNGTLPGKLVVNSSAGPASVFDLRTGRRVALPRSTNTADPDKDRWAVGSGATAARWYLNVGLSGRAPVTLFDTTTWQAIRELSFPTEFRAPVPSPDGRYLLTFWQDVANGETSADERLTIFSATTGDVVKRGSQLDGVLILSSPVAWLPDGRYVYLAGNKLFVSSPISATSQLVATLALPGAGAALPSAFGSSLAVSPDGSKLAFTWSEAARNTSTDTHIWVVNLDGTGLRRLTAAPDSTSALNFIYGSPTWSPDGQWIAGALYMSGTSIAPVYPPDETVAPAWQVAGATGCSSNPVFVLPANAENRPISWPLYDAKYGVKVINAANNGGEWISACDTIAWIP